MSPLTAAALAGASSAFAQRPTPKTWSYELDSSGHRIPKANHVTKPDGSWREETRQGNCVTVKERSATGEYRETRECDPPKRS